LLQLFNTSATAKLQLSSTSAAAAKLPTVLYLCNSSTAPTFQQNQQKNCSQIRRLCSKFELKSTKFWSRFCGQNCKFVHKIC
jgi:hypothetical protein